MEQIRREAQKALIEGATYFPVVTITGPRQAGKTTLARQTFPDHSYINLEDPEIFDFAKNDMSGFFERYKPPVIIDEVQRLPELLRKIQVLADQSKMKGRFILTGSFQTALKAAVSESLAGRTALINLLPFSIEELKDSARDFSRDDFLFKGFMPRLYSEGQPENLLYRNYFSTYVERDLQQILQVKNLSLFDKFIKILAGRIGQVVNAESLSNDTGVSAVTIKEWISVLESSFLIFKLEPYFNNYTKRLVKSPKIYFTETGLAAYLLGIKNAAQVSRDPLMGNLFENMVILEVLKKQLNNGGQKELYYFRDSKGFEIDLLVPSEGRKIIPVEIKAAQTYHADFTKNISKFMEFSPDAVNPAVIYSGEEEFSTKGVQFLNFKNAASLIKES